MSDVKDVSDVDDGNDVSDANHAQDSDEMNDTEHRTMNNEQPSARPSLCVAPRLLAVAVGLLVGLGGPRAAGAHSEEATISHRTYSPIVVDGKLGDWTRRLERSNWVGRLETTKGEVLEWLRAVPVHMNPLSCRVEAGTVSRPSDFMARVYTLWDLGMFYVAAVVRDDQLVGDHDGKDIWQDDALELWLDCRHDAVSHTLVQDDEYQLGFAPAAQGRPHAAAWAWRNPDTEPVIKAMQVASTLTNDGYILEGAVPWQVLHGCSPKLGGMIGFNISMVDKDEDQVWTHVTWAGEVHSDPSQFGHLFFLDAPVDLFPSDVFEAPAGPSPWESKP